MSASFNPSASSPIKSFFKKCAGGLSNSLGELGRAIKRVVCNPSAYIATIVGVSVATGLCSILSVGALAAIGAPGGVAFILGGVLIACMQYVALKS